MFLRNVSWFHRTTQRYTTEDKTLHNLKLIAICFLTILAAEKSAQHNSSFLNLLVRKCFSFSQSPCPMYYKKFWEELIAYFYLIQHGLHRKGRIQQFFYCCVFIRCRRNVFTEPLPSNDKGYTYRCTDWWEGFMKCAPEIGSVALMYT
jgi:hypothetical protein